MEFGKLGSCLQLLAQVLIDVSSFSNEGLEPPHIHIQKGNALAKFWLDPVELSSSSGFAAHELRRLQEMVEERRAEFEVAWNDFFRP
jgi:hypothetical protein